MHRLAWLPLLLGLSVPLSAQRVSISGGGGHASFTGRGGAFGHHSPAPLLYPFGLSPFYWDGVGNAEYREAAEPRVIVVQQQPAAVVPPAPPAQPLLIELHGDQYVQVSGEASAAPSREKPLAVNVARNGDTAVRGTVSETLNRVVLVFRDGHREEIPTYTISSGVLYAGADSYTGVTTPRKIELSALSLQETVELNRSRGLRFLLPSAGNEVVVGP
jgi:hypothetical protein